MTTSLEKSFDKAMVAVHGLPAEGDYLGTCQACFGQFVVKQRKSSESRAGGGWKRANAGKLVVVLHGYKRPGVGYIIGDCLGQGEEPFELAKDITEKFCKDLKHMQGMQQKYLAKLKAGEVTELQIQVDDRSGVRDPWKAWPRKQITIHPGWKNDNLSEGIRDFESAVRIAIFNTESLARQIARDVKYTEERIASWKYDPQALVQARSKIASVKEAKVSTRKVEQDVKEAHVLAVLQTFFDHQEFMAFLKSRNAGDRYGLAKEERHAQSGQPTLFDQYMQRVEKARSHKLYGDRMWSLKSITSDLKDIASGGYGVPKFKVKLPKKPAA